MDNFLPFLQTKTNPDFMQNFIIKNTIFSNKEKRTLFFCLMLLYGSYFMQNVIRIQKPKVVRFLNSKKLVKKSLLRKIKNFLVPKGR